MGAYENPVPIVDKSSGQNLAALQGMVAKNFAMGMQGYQARQKEIRLKKEKEDIRIGKILKKGEDEVTLMQRSVIRSQANKDNKFKKVDWPQFFEADISEYEKLSEGLALGTSKSPGDDKRRMNEIFGQVTNLTDSLGYISATANTINESLNGSTANKPGGIYTGEQADTIEAFSIFSGQIDGSRQPRKQDGKIVWDVFDGEGKLVETIDPALLSRLSDLDQSVVTTISNPNADGEWNKQQINSTLLQSNGVDVNGKRIVSDRHNKQGIVPEFLIKSGIKIDRTNNGGYTSTQMYSADYNLMMQDSSFAVDSAAAVEGMFGGSGKNGKSAKAYGNTQMQNIKLTKENFINNPLFRNPDGSAKYTKENLVEGDPVGGEAFAMLNDSDNSGDYLFDLESNLTDPEKDIFNLMYQKKWLKENVQEKNIASITSNSSTKSEINLNNFKTVLKETYADDDKYKIEKGGSKINASAVLTDMLNNDAINNSALTDFLVVTEDVINQQKSNFEADYGNSLVQSGDADINPDGSTKYDRGADDGPQRQEMEKQKADLVKDLQKAIDEKSVYDKRTGAVLTYDMMNAKIQTKQKEALSTRTNPPTTPPTTAAPPAVTPPQVAPPPLPPPAPASSNDGYGEAPLSSYKNYQDRKKIQKELNPEWTKFRKETKVKNTIAEFEKWFDSGRPSKPLGTNNKGEEFDIS